MPLSERGGATLRVEPDQILRLKARLKAVRDRVDTFLHNKIDLLHMRQLGADPVSEDTARVFNENARAAVTAAYGFHAELTSVIDALDRSAQAYDLIEKANAHKYQERGR